MHFVIGGAYQGKLDYAREQFSLKEEDICTCTKDAAPDFSARCLNHYENYILFCLRQQNRDYDGLLSPDAVVIADDIFCGVVPVDEETRAWREECGRALTAIAKKADTVTRLFCGIPRRLK